MAPTPRSAPTPPPRTRRSRSSTPRPSRAPTRWWSRPTTPTAICDALNEARDAGTKVVTFDSDTDPECRDLYINQASAEGIAKAQVDLIAEQIGDSGEVAILSAAANATNQNAWIDLMKTDLEPRTTPTSSWSTPSTATTTTRPPSTRPRRCCRPPRPQGHHQPDHGRHRGCCSLPVDLGRQGQGRADRSGHAQPDA